MFRPSVTCLTSLGSVARIPARNYLHILATVKSILWSQACPPHWLRLATAYRAVFLHVLSQLSQQTDRTGWADCHYQSEGETITELSTQSGLIVELSAQERRGEKCRFCLTFEEIKLIHSYRNTLEQTELEPDGNLCCLSAPGDKWLRCSDVTIKLEMMMVQLSSRWCRYHHHHHHHVWLTNYTIELDS